MPHFLVTYDRLNSHTSVRRFDDAFDAFDAFAVCEREHMGDTNLEVVLLAGEREEDLRATHPNFFALGDLLPAT